MTNIDKALESFNEFKRQYDELKNKDITESDTRSKLLDFMLINVLGWQESYIQREGYSDAGYYDYRLSIPSFHFICEAKKNFENFTLPTRHNSVTLGTLSKQNAEVINQIRSYLLEEGLQFGVITNGHQFIVARFINSDGKSWKSNKALIFKSVDDIESRFIDFYNLLSKDSVIENTGFNVEDEEEFAGKTIYSTINNPEKELIRNSLSSNITPLLDSVFGEIFTSDFGVDDVLVKECFVSNKEIKKNRSEIEQLFFDLSPKLEEVIPAVNTENILNQIENELQNDNISIRDISPPKPIIIIGSKGAGKTTFIHYLFNNFFSDKTKSSHPVIYLDIRKYTAYDLKNNHSKIYSDLVENLFDRYPNLGLHTRKVLIRIFIKEIKRNDEGIWAHLDRNSDNYEKILASFLTQKMSDVENYFIKISEYLIRERRIRICTVFDNADQLDIEIQREAFILSHSINSKARCGVILALRKGYYIKWRNKPPFDAYYSHVYNITAPPYGEVLQRRIEYALKEVEKTGKVIGHADLFSNTDASVEVPKQAIIDFLNSAKKTLFSRVNSAMLDFLSNTTYPNIREGLRVFKRFLVSGHTQVEQYVIRQSTAPKSPIPIPVHEFVKAIALDNKLVYNSETSIVCNLFRPVAGSRNHFIKYKILKYLSSFSINSSKGEEFILLHTLVEEFGKAGYRRNILLRETDELLENGLIESQELISDTDEPSELTETDSISITLKGFYYVNRLVNTFHYLELMAQDTPIFDSEAFEKLNSNFVEADRNGRRKLKSRESFVKAFYDYLCKAEEKETVDGNTIIKGIMNDIFNNGLIRDFKKIEEVIKGGK